MDGSNTSAEGTPCLRGLKIVGEGEGEEERRKEKKEEKIIRRKNRLHVLYTIV